MSLAFKIFLTCALTQLLYYLVVFLRLNFVRPFKSLPEFPPPVSLVICAKNEAQQLVRNLKVVLIQQYKQFEVIVVNDQSTDNTADVLVDFYMRNKNVKIVNIAPGQVKPYPGKKYALMKGIETASYDTIVVTDADCRPATTHWLAKLVGTYMSGTQIVLGYSPYEKQPGFLNRVIRYENFMSAMQYFGFAKLGLPYMGVGRNLSYKKQVFENFKGFDESKNILTGDDDLLVNAAANSKNTEICVDKDAFTYTRPETTLKSWLNQKKRHLRSGFKYKFIHQAMLFIFAATNFIFYVSFAVLMLKGVFWKQVAVLFIILLLVKFIVTFRIYKKLGSADLRFLSPVLDIIYAGYLLVIFLLLLLKRKDNWKI